MPAPAPSLSSTARAQGSAPAAAAAARSAWDKVFSDAQAKRGQAAYLRECAPCHGDDLRGIGLAPALGPDDFLFVWENRTLGDLFDRIRTAMPPDRPGALPPESYRDIVAFLLSANQFPAGDTELDVDEAALRQVLITARPAGAR
jgi:mono/diheme cytochrome c family protein